MKFVVLDNEIAIPLEDVEEFMKSSNYVSNKKSRIVGKGLALVPKNSDTEHVYNILKDFSSYLGTKELPVEDINFTDCSFDIVIEEFYKV